MCGISAFLDLRKSRTAKALTTRTSDRDVVDWTSRLDRSNEVMRHRGPDAKGIWVSDDNVVGLGHVRLSTRDLSCAGDQPLHSDKNVHVVVNGELYYPEYLRAELAKNYVFTSSSDSEMAIALYEHFGVDFVQHLRGEYSMILYDGKHRRLVAVRDRFGVKPLHYSMCAGRLLLATQCKGIIELMSKDEPVRWDAQCLAQGGGHYGDRTLFDGIRKFPPGHILVVKLDQEEDPVIKPYFHFCYPANADGMDDRPAEMLRDELHSRLLEAVRIRLNSSDVPVGILLSGGVDSSAVAGISAHLVREGLAASPKPTCFTIAFPDDDKLDESEIAARTAAHLGLTIERVLVTEQVFVDEFDEACWLGEALMWDLQHIAKKALSRHIQDKGFKVVLNGDGSDELFGGYPYFVTDRLEEDDKNRAPALVATTTSQREVIRQSNAATTKWFGTESTIQEHPTNRFAQALGLSRAFCNLAVSRHDDWLLRSVQGLSNPFRAIWETFTPVEIAQMQDYHPLHRSLLAWNKTCLPNMVIAAISDGAEMAHSVESRPPFLDHHVAEFAFTLPVDTLVHLNSEEPPTEKWIFREAVRPYITEEVYRRRKHAFAAPFRWEMGGLLYRKLSQLITREHVEQLGFADWTKCADLVDRAFGDKDQVSFRQAIWLAQIISMGRQFGVERWLPTDRKEVDQGSREMKSTEVQSMVQTLAADQGQDARFMDDVVQLGADTRVPVA